VRPEGAPVAAGTAVWMVLGVSRSDFTLVTGRLTSRRGGGEHALGAFPARWRPLVEECLRLRRHGLPGATSSEAAFAEAVRFVAMVLDETRRAGSPPGPGPAGRRKG
jgi:hypothetical protein